MATKGPYIVEAANLFMGDHDPEADNALTLETIQLPALEQTMIEYNPGGGIGAANFATTMLGALAMPFKLRGMDPDRIGLFGLGSNRRRIFTGYGAVRNKRDNTGIKAKFIVEGVIGSISATEFARGSGIDFDYKIAEVVNYQLWMDEREVYYYDWFNKVFRVDGVDEYAETRSLLGLG